MCLPLNLALRPSGLRPVPWPRWCRQCRQPVLRPRFLRHPSQCGQRLAIHKDRANVRGACATTSATTATTCIKGVRHRAYGAQAQHQLAGGAR
eukprot:7378590-Prymnesium_polylepis.1